MNSFKAKGVRFYFSCLSVISLIMLIIAIFDLGNVVNLLEPPFSIIDLIACIIFTIDFFARLSLTKKKSVFLYHNIWDLISMIPYSLVALLIGTNTNSLIWIIFKIVMIIALTERFKKNAHKYFHFHGFMHLFYITTAIMVFGATVYSISENTSIGESLWWAVVTAATVGYGDVSPHTAIGKVAAVVLMFVGIGSIGLLTSAVTYYLIGGNPTNDTGKLKNELKLMEIKIDQINQKLDQLDQLLDAKQTVHDENKNKTDQPIK